MSNNSIGKNFVVTSFGESHGEAIGVVIDGCPAGITLNLDKIRQQMQRRRPGQSEITTQRKEKDDFKFVSGLIESKTTGAPICIMIANTGQRPSDYEAHKTTYRPSHADFTYDQKYGIRDPFGGGRSSARVTAGWVAAGAIAQQIIEEQYGIYIGAYVKQIHRIQMEESDKEYSFDEIESSKVRCPETNISDRMVEYISAIKKEGNSVGGVVHCVIKNCPVGLGEPIFNKLHAQLGMAMLNINAVKGFEFGSGFNSVNFTGAEMNDEWAVENGRAKTTTNNSGGIQGGISNGMPIYFNVAFKPTASIAKKQTTINSSFEQIDVEIDGRHDPCVVPRAVPIVETLTAIVLLDNLLSHHFRKP